MHLKLFIFVVSFTAVLAADQDVANETKISPRIADGLEPPLKPNYYEVAIVSDSQSKPSVLCSGVLIKTEWVLTSANCIKKKKVWRILVGNTFVLNPATLGDTGILVDDFIIHPSFNSFYMIHDIALLHVKGVKQFPATTFAELPPYPINVKEYNDQYARVLGYGKQGSEGTADYYLLRYKDVLITDISHCVETGNYMNYYKLCTGGRAICVGDEGGPLMIGNTVIGIASTAVNSYNCEMQNTATFTRVNYYKQWIDNTILTHKC